MDILWVHTGAIGLTPESGQYLAIEARDIASVLGWAAYYIIPQQLP